MTPEKAVYNDAIKEEMVNSIYLPTISDKEVESIPHDIDWPVNWKKINVIEDSLIGLQTIQFSTKNENTLVKVLSSERDLVHGLLKKRISDD